MHPSAELPQTEQMAAGTVPWLPTRVTAGAATRPWTLTRPTTEPRQTEKMEARIVPGWPTRVTAGAVTGSCILPRPMTLLRLPAPPTPLPLPPPPHLLQHPLRLLVVAFYTRVSLGRARPRRPARLVPRREMLALLPPTACPLKRTRCSTYFYGSYVRRST